MRGRPLGLGIDAHARVAAWGLKSERCWSRIVVGKVGRRVSWGGRGKFYGRLWRGNVGVLVAIRCHWGGIY